MKVLANGSRSACTGRPTAPKAPRPSLSHVLSAVFSSRRHTQEQACKCNSSNSSSNSDSSLDASTSSVESSGQSSSQRRTLLLGLCGGFMAIGRHPAQAAELGDTLAGLLTGYSSYDVNYDGELSLDELRAGFADASSFVLAPDGEPVIADEDVPLPPRAALQEQLVPVIDFNRDGKVQVDEFLRALSLEAPLDEEAWKVIDKNQDGRATLDELRAALGDLGGPDGDAVIQVAFNAAAGGGGKPRRGGQPVADSMTPEETNLALSWVATGVLGDLMAP